MRWLLRLVIDDTRGGDTTYMWSCEFSKILRTTVLRAQPLSNNTGSKQQLSIAYYCFCENNAACCVLRTSYRADDLTNRCVKLLNRSIRTCRLAGSSVSILSGGYWTAIDFYFPSMCAQCERDKGHPPKRALTFSLKFRFDFPFERNT